MGQLMVLKILKMFPMCHKITLIDGYDYQLIPINTEYGHTILGAAEKCIIYVEENGLPLEVIYFELNEKLIEGRLQLLEQYQAKLKALGWTCSEKNKRAPEQNEAVMCRYRTCRVKADENK